MAARLRKRGLLRAGTRARCPEWLSRAGLGAQRQPRRAGGQKAVSGRRPGGAPLCAAPWAGRRAHPDAARRRGLQGGQGAGRPLWGRGA